MKQSFYIKLHRTGIVLLCLVLLGNLLSLCAFANSVVRDYSVTVDNPTSVTVQGAPAVLKNLTCGTDPTLTVKGWVKINENVKAYEYSMDGGKTWKRSTKAVVSRPDVKKFCPNTYNTAGFDIEFDLSELERGEYDLYVRAYTDTDKSFDVLAILNVSVGQTDIVTMAYRELNLFSLGAADGTLAMQADTPLVLGTYNLRDFERAEIITDTDAVMMLKSSPSHALPFSATSQASVQNDDGTFTATIDLKNEQFAGEILLTSDQASHILQIRFYTNVPDYYQGELKVHMTSTPFEYLSGANYADGTLMADETVGTYLRLFPTDQTGDPYIYFGLGKYLKQTEQKQISADHYRYAVMTLQTPSTNSDGYFRLFLCAGNIHGPHGESHVAFSPKNDGEWHKYVIPLCEEEHWTGTIYGMRFDFIDGYAKTDDYANIASIEFFPDLKSANAAAAQPFEVYHEQGEAPQDQYKEENRAPSGKADAITWFDTSFESCFGGENKATYRFDEYGHVILQATESTNDPYVSFSLQQYAALTGLPLLRADDYNVIVLRVMADKKIEDKNFVLYYYSGGYNYAEGSRTAACTFQGDEWEYLVYDMTGKNAWTAEILGMRLDFAGQISAGQKVCLADMLFFEDMDAWEFYAKQNGIANKNDPYDTETPTQAPETEIPTIEIPTKGPGLEYIPPEQIQQNRDSASCQSMLSLPLGLILTFSVMILIKNKKGDQS